MADGAQGKLAAASRSRWSLRDGWALLACLAAVLAVALLARAGFDQFFMIDDAQNEYLPKYMDIGRSLRQGVWPLLTPRIWLGGNYVVEYQYGVFNPVQLVICAVMSWCDSLRTASFVFAATYLCIGAAGLYTLGRTIGLSRGLSTLLGFFAGAELMVLYVYAASWYPGLCGFAWFGWTVAAIWRTLSRPTGWSAVAVVAGTYLVLTAGWPQSVVALFLAAACLALCGSLGRPPGPRAARVALLAVLIGAGVMLAAPAWMEMLATRPLTLRSSGLHNDANFMTFGLRQALLAHLPAFRDYMHWFAGYRLMSLPLGYASLLLAAVVFFCRWPERPAPAAGPALAFGVSAVVLLLIAMGPSQLGPMRWPVRFVPYFHACLLCCALVVGQHGALRTSPARIWAFLGCAVLGSAIAVLQAEGLSGGIRIRAVALAAVLLCVSAWAFVTWRHRIVPAAMTGVMLLCGVLAHARVLSDLPTLAPGYLSYAGLPSRLASVQDDPLLHRGFALLMAPAEVSLGQRKSSVAELNSAQGLLWGVPTVNGYSPIGHAALAQLLPAASAHGLFNARQAVSNMLTESRRWGVHLPTIMGIGAMVVPSSDVQSGLGAELRQLGFQPGRDLGARQVWVRPQQEPPCGLPTALDAGVRVDRDAMGDGCQPSWRFRVSSGPAGGTVLLPRLWWPGYRASLNGDKELDVRPWHGLVVALRLPPGAQGEVQVSYRPSAFGSAVALALAGSVVGLAGVVAAARAGRMRGRRVRPTPGG